MKIVMKVYLITLSLMGTNTFYCAEKKLNPDKIVRDGWKNEGHIDQKTIDTLLQQQRDRMKEESISFLKATVQNYIDADQRVPERIIRNADPETASLARTHNDALTKHYQALQQLPQG